MIRSILISFIVLLVSISYGQDIISQLIEIHAGDAKIVEQIKEFEKDGIEKPFDYRNVTPEILISNLRNYIGTPYKYGGLSKSGIDCSGLIVKTMEDLGLYAPHSAQELARYGKIIIDKNDLKSGDFIFFKKTYETPNLVSHAGFVVDEGKMIHASSSKGVIETEYNNPYYWDNYFLFGTRIFEEIPIITTPKLPEFSTYIGYTEKVLTTIYDVRHRGRYTDSGERYNPGDLTASHPTLPFETIIKVTNPLKNRSVEVRINDGDSGRDNINLTLSRKALRKLRIKREELSIEVKIEVIRIN